MIVVDTSALIAILKNEPDAALFAKAIGDADDCFLSAVSLLEGGLVAIGLGAESAADDLDDLVRLHEIKIVPFDADLAAIARDAFIRFGKGRHPAGLNMGDCASYALAKALGLPLLFKGDDFSQTDVLSALA
ncbi:MAG TPA: type II toxin-antitoxin system VapC family toxin [Azospirillum sp.]|nr:type II toxin-antitoxin system VapC family toxin [Azospirillum sp.]